jgi:ADP-ribose pyrophosphatase
MVDLGRYFASPGMSSEGFTLLRAEAMVRTGEGGGVEGENIVVHRVPLSEVSAFVAGKRAEGCAIDVKLLLLLAGELLADS